MPPASDLKQQGEPEYPVAALAPCPTGTDETTCPAAIAERDWHDKVLTWGRTGWAQNRRVCQWAVDLGLDVPKGYCAEPAPTP